LLLADLAAFCSGCSALWNHPVGEEKINIKVVLEAAFPRTSQTTSFVFSLVLLPTFLTLPLASL